MPRFCYIVALICLALALTAYVVPFTPPGGYRAWFLGGVLALAFAVGGWAALKSLFRE